MHNKRFPQEMINVAEVLGHSADNRNQSIERAVQGVILGRSFHIYSQCSPFLILVSLPRKDRDRGVRVAQQSHIRTMCANIVQIMYIKRSRLAHVKEPAGVLATDTAGTRVVAECSRFFVCFCFHEFWMHSIEWTFPLFLNYPG